MYACDVFYSTLMMRQTSGVVSYSSRDKSLRDFNVLATIGKGSYGQMFKVFDKHRGVFEFHHVSCIVVVIPF